MDIFGALIETFALSAVGWLTTKFVRYSWHRGTGRPVATAEPSQPIAQPQPSFSDSVVAFRRPQPKLDDRQLIEFAKSINYTGSKKWGFNRKLSTKVRAELRQLWTGHQQLKAG